MHKKKIQDFLFQRIREALPPGCSLADIVAEVLCVSQDSAYRRIRGETPLVLEEARILCQQFNISLDQLWLLNNNSVVFQTTEFDTITRDFAGFLKGVIYELKQLEIVDQKSIIYVCKDIPLFHQLGSKAVLAFRHFFWMRNVFQHPDFIRQKFSMHYLTPEIEVLGQELLSTYCKIPSIEIWSVESINGILLQLHYYMQAGILPKENMQEICASLYQTLEHLQVQAAYGRKFMPGEDPRSKKDNFQLFYNRMGVANNTILATCNGRKKVYLNYEALSYIDTSDEKFCNQVHQQLQMNMRRSTLISSISEKQRHIFFNTLYAKLPRYAVDNAKMAS